MADVEGPLAAASMCFVWYGGAADGMLEALEAVHTTNGELK